MTPQLTERAIEVALDHLQEKGKRVRQRRPSRQKAVGKELRIKHAEVRFEDLLRDRLAAAARDFPEGVPAWREQEIRAEVRAAVDSNFVGVDESRLPRPRQRARNVLRDVIVGNELLGSDPDDRLVQILVGRLEQEGELRKERNKPPLRAVDIERIAKKFLDEMASAPQPSSVEVERRIRAAASSERQKDEQRLRHLLDLRARIQAVEETVNTISALRAERITAQNAGEKGEPFPDLITWVENLYGPGADPDEISHGVPRTVGYERARELAVRNAERRLKKAIEHFENQLAADRAAIAGRQLADVDAEIAQLRAAGIAEPLGPDHRLHALHRQRQRIKDLEREERQLQDAESRPRPNEPDKARSYDAGLENRRQAIERLRREIANASGAVGADLGAIAREIRDIETQKRAAPVGGTRVEPDVTPRIPKKRSRSRIDRVGRGLVRVADAVDEVTAALGAQDPELAALVRSEVQDQVQASDLPVGMQRRMRLDAGRIFTSREERNNAVARAAAEEIQKLGKDLSNAEKLAVLKQVGARIDEEQRRLISREGLPGTSLGVDVRQGHRALAPHEVDQEIKDRLDASVQAKIAQGAGAGAIGNLAAALRKAAREDYEQKIADQRATIARIAPQARREARDIGWDIGGVDRQIQDLLRDLPQPHQLDRLVDRQVSAGVERALQNPASKAHAEYERMRAEIAAQVKSEQAGAKGGQGANQALRDELTRAREERSRLWGELRRELPDLHPTDYGQVQGVHRDAAQRFLQLDRHIQLLQHTLGLAKKDPSELEGSRLGPDLEDFLSRGMGIGRRSVKPGQKGKLDAPIQKADPANPSAPRETIGRIAVSVPTETTVLTVTDRSVAPKEVTRRVGIAQNAGDMYATAVQAGDEQVRQRFLDPEVLNAYSEWQAAKEARKEHNAERNGLARAFYERYAAPRIATWEKNNPGKEMPPSVKEAIEAGRPKTREELQAFAQGDEWERFEAAGRAAAEWDDRVQQAEDRFRDLFWGDTPLGGSIGSIERGSRETMGAPSGQAVGKNYVAHRDDVTPQSDLDRGRVPRRINQGRNAKPGAKADPFRITLVDDPDKDAWVGGRPPMEMGQETVLVPAKERIEVERPLLIDRNTGIANLELRDSHGNVVAEVPVVMKKTPQGDFVPDRGNRVRIQKALDDAKTVLGASKDPNRWPKGTPWKKRGIGPGRFRSKVGSGLMDIHIIPTPFGFEVHATPFDETGRKPLTAIVNDSPSDVAEPAAEVRDRGFMRSPSGELVPDNPFGAAMAKAAAMVNKGRAADKAAPGDKAARIIYHQGGANGERIHIRDYLSGVVAAEKRRKRSSGQVRGGKKGGVFGAPMEFIGGMVEGSLREGFASGLFENAKRTIRRAHSAFQMESLRRLYPDLAGQLFQERYESERGRDEEFLLRMEARLRRKIEAAVGDPNLTIREKAQKAQAALNRERQYFRQHLSESAWRMARTAEYVRLRESGATGAYWLMDHGLREHSDDCLSMEGRVWSWDVLDVVNPANRHPGCGCRLISESEARALGLPIKRGVRSKRWREAVPDGERIHEWDSVVAEALEEFDPDQPRWPRGHPLGGQWRDDLTDVEIARLGSFERDWNTPDRTGNKQRLAHGTYRGMMDRTKVGPSGQAERTAIQNVAAGIANPTGARTLQGDPHDVGKNGAPVPRPTVPIHGIFDGWANGSFQWDVSDLPQGVIDTLGRVQTVKITAGEDGRQTMTLTNQWAPMARYLERAEPRLRRLRTLPDGTFFTDDAPIEVAYGERYERGLHKRTRYANIDARQLGDAAETLINDVVQRLVELDILPEGTVGHFQSAGGGSGLDWVAGGWGFEVKASSWRGMEPGAPIEGPGIKAAEAADKRAEAQELGLKPALVQVVTDLDNDTAHVFLQTYNNEERAYTSVRLPQEAIEGIFSGALSPGAQLHPERGAAKGQTIFVGSFRLKYNPMASPEHYLRADDAVQVADRPVRVMDRGVPPDAEVDLDARRVTGAEARQAQTSFASTQRSERDKELLRDALANLENFGDAKQTELAKKFDTTQPTISRRLNKMPEWREALAAKSAAKKPKPDTPTKAPSDDKIRNAAVASALTSIWRLGGGRLNKTAQRTLNAAAAEAMRRMRTEIELGAADRDTVKEIAKEMAAWASKKLDPQPDGSGGELRIDNRKPWEWEVPHTDVGRKLAYDAARAAADTLLERHERSIRDDEITARYVAGEAPSRMVSDYGITVAQIHRILDAKGVVKRGRGRPRKDKRALQEMGLSEAQAERAYTLTLEMDEDECERFYEALESLIPGEDDGDDKTTVKRQLLERLVTTGKVTK